MIKLGEKRVLVLGGLGFIGSNLALRLRDLGARITLVDSMLPMFGGNLANIPEVNEEIAISLTDVRDYDSLSNLVNEADVIFALAGQTSHTDSMRDPLTDLDLNCKALLNLLEAWRASSRSAVIVFTSTRQVYGRAHSLPVDENHPTIPTDVNGINKLACERYLSLYAQIYGLRCVSLRLTNTYGPRLPLVGNSRGVIGFFLERALEGKKVPVYGDGKQVRDFNFVDDVVEALLLAATYSDKLQHGVYNLGSNEVYSLVEFVSILHEMCLFEHYFMPFPRENETIDIGSYYGNFSLFSDETGWIPRISLREGIRRTVDYAQMQLKGHGND
jgi:UDP-glucose 4-epimerase